MSYSRTSSTGLYIYLEQHGYIQADPAPAGPYLQPIPTAFELHLTPRIIPNYMATSVLLFAYENSFLSGSWS